MQNLDPLERDKFGALAAQWWDRDGPLRTLHDINPCRLAFVGEMIPLDGARALDVGCGGGLFSESLAHAGAHVTALDASAELIEIARDHAAAQGMPIDYRVATAETFATSHAGRYDLVTCLELIEHVPDPLALLGACAALLRPGGVLVVSTLSRTPRAYVLGVLMAEYVLNLVPRGTHDYTQFIRPAELARAARQHGLDVRDVRGMDYNPLLRRAWLTRNPQVNYLATFTRTTH